MKKQNNKITKTFYLVIAIIFLIAFAQDVLALGITPGRAVYDYAPGRQEDVAFKVINNEHKNMKILLYVEGELNQSITLYNTVLEFTSSEEEKDLKYTFKLPESLEEPRMHVTRIIAREIPEKTDEGTFVGATVAVASELYIKVPYYGKYLELKMTIRESDVNGTTIFDVSASNFGEQNIARAYAIIDILGKTNEIIDTVKTETFAIDTKQRKDLIAEWKANVNPGTYVAKATIIYDEKIDTIEKTFTVGTERIDLVDVVVEDFRLGGIAKFTIVGENKWNSEIKDVYSRVVIYDSADRTIADSRSASVDFPALKRTTMFAFWDTAGIDVGRYEGKIFLYYSNKSIDKEIKVNVQTDQLDVEVVGLTAKVVGNRSSDNTTFWLIAIVVILILINAAWFLYFKNRLNRKK